MNKSQTERRLEEMERLLASIDKSLALNTQSLIEHIRRTEILEEQMKPVMKHVEQMRGASKLLAILALLATIVTAIAAF